MAVRVGEVEDALDLEKRPQEDARQNREPRPTSYIEHPVPHLRVSFFLFWSLFGAVTAASFLINESVSGPLNYYLTIVWSLFFPLAAVGLLGAARTGRTDLVTFDGTVEQLVIFVVPTVARMDTLPALRRVIRSILREAPRHMENFRIDVVVDEGAKGISHIRARYATEPRVRLLVVPADYDTQRGAIHKSRANQYALDIRTKDGESRDDVFVYHLDDDTGVGPDTIASIASFIATDDGTVDLAQGVLAFPHHLTSSWFCALADSIRPGDDLTRFQFFTGVLAKPLGGLHGEHLLVRASAEAAVGWDFKRTKVEDAHFALHFARAGRRSCFLPSFSYGASPSKVRDLVRQRRRWAGGLIALAFDRSLPLRTRTPLAYAVVVWASGLFQHVGLMVIVALLAQSGGTSPALAWVLPLWSLNFAYILWQYLEGLRINTLASRGGRPYVLNAVLVVALLFFFTLIEAFSALLGLKDAVAGNDGFEVISKPVALAAVVGSLTLL